MKKIITIFGIAAMLMAGCTREIELQESDLEYTPTESESGAAASSDGYYTITKVLQYSDENPDGLDIKPYFDWFDSFNVQMTVENGTIIGIKIDNGDVPHDRYGFTLPSEVEGCYFDDSATPYCIRRSSDDQLLVTYQGADLYFDFTLADKGISYRYVLSATTKEEE